MFGKAITGLVTLLALGPAIARAENIAFRNDTGGMVVVQITVIIQSAPNVPPRVEKSKPHLLGVKALSPPINLPGNKLVTIYDAKAPTRVLYQGTIEPTPDDTIYSIQPDTPPKLKLVPQKVGGG